MQYPLIVRLSGGLGNQLFQIAAGIKAAKLTCVDSLFLDTRFLGNYESKRDFSTGFLSKFVQNVDFGVPPLGVLSMASRFRLGRIVDWQFKKLALIKSVRGLNGLLPDKKWGVVLDGYFQHSDVLFDEEMRTFLRKQLFDERRGLLQKYVWDGPVVGVHIRRGDYVSSKPASRVFKAIPYEFYRRSIQTLDVRSRFLVFSDDKEAAQLFASEIGGINVASLGLTLQDEFCLLAACNHAIIANSTFSWWAAWLGYEPGKQLITPRRWYVDEGRSINNPLLLPQFRVMD